MKLSVFAKEPTVASTKPPANATANQASKITYEASTKVLSSALVEEPS
jgi:hypothetical protein